MSEYTEYPDLNMADDFDRAIWQIRAEYSDAADIEAELRLAKAWADSVMVDYDEGPCAIEFTKGADKFWYLIGDASWDADDPRSDLIRHLLADRDRLAEELKSVRVQCAQAIEDGDGWRDKYYACQANRREENSTAQTALRERDELRAEVERLLSIVANDMRDIERYREALKAARYELSVAASYADEPNQPMGLRVHARACAKVITAIDVTFANTTTTERK